MNNEQPNRPDRVAIYNPDGTTRHVLVNSTWTHEDLGTDAMDDLRWDENGSGFLPREVMVHILALRDEVDAKDARIRELEAQLGQPAQDVPDCKWVPIFPSALGQMAVSTDQMRARKGPHRALLTICGDGFGRWAHHQPVDVKKEDGTLYIGFVPSEGVSQ